LATAWPLLGHFGGFGGLSRIELECSYRQCLQAFYLGFIATKRNLRKPEKTVKLRTSDQKVAGSSPAGCTTLGRGEGVLLGDRNLLVSDISAKISFLPGNRVFFPRWVFPVIHSPLSSGATGNAYDEQPMGTTIFVTSRLEAQLIQLQKESSRRASSV